MGIKFTVGGRAIELTPDQVTQVMRDVSPERITKHLVELNGSVYPPKQVLATLTGWERQSFTTQEAQRVLGRLGFTCRRASQGDREPAWEPVATEGPTEVFSGERLVRLESSIATIQAAIRGLHERLERLEG